MKTLLFILLFTLSGFIISAQNNSDSPGVRPLNNVNLNVLGDASIISLNYERLFLISENNFITAKLGVGYNQELQLFSWGSDTPSVDYITIPHHISANFGKTRHFLEVGLGGTYFKGNTPYHYLLYPLVGYRFQPLKTNNINFRVFVCYPFKGIDSKETDDKIFFPIGLSAGICF